jgi:hypothetical protein
MLQKAQQKPNTMQPKRKLKRKKIHTTLETQ